MVVVEDVKPQDLLKIGAIPIKTMKDGDQLRRDTITRPESKQEEKLADNLLVQMIETVKEDVNLEEVSDFDKTISSQKKDDSLKNKSKSFNNKDYLFAPPPKLNKSLVKDEVNTSFQANVEDLKSKSPLRESEYQ